MLVTVAVGAGSAAAIDFRTRRIPNAVSAGTAALGIALAATGLSGISVASSMFGFLGGLVLMMPGRLLGATGAGDVKLMAAVGAVLGIERMPVAFVGTAIAGGVLAVVIAVQRGRLKAAIGGTGRMLRTPGQARDHIESAGAHHRFSYGPAIAAGALLAAWFGR
jgi:prepilin peptidase CpaA